MSQDYKYYDFTFVAYEPVEQIGCYAYDGSLEEAREDFIKALEERYGENQYKVTDFKESENPDLFTYAAQMADGSNSIN